MLVPYSLFSDSRRLATFTTSPITVYSKRYGVPMFPTSTSPTWKPMRARNAGFPDFAQAIPSSLRRSCERMAARQARVT